MWNLSTLIKRPRRKHGAETQEPVHKKASQDGSVPRHGNIDGLPDIRQLHLRSMFDDEGMSSDKSQHETMIIEWRSPKDFYRKHVRDYRFTGLGKVLDLAGGWGRWSPFLAEYNDDLVIADTSPYLLKIAEKIMAYCELQNFETAVFPGEEIPYKDSSFDGVWVHAALYLMDRRKALQEIARVLRPGGRLMVGADRGPGRMLQLLCTRYGSAKYAETLDHIVSGDGRIFGTPPTWIYRKDIPEMLHQFGMELDPECPLLDFKTDTYALSDEEQKIIQNMPLFAKRFSENQYFRERFMDNYRNKVREIENNFWYGAVKK